VGGTKGTVAAHVMGRLSGIGHRSLYKNILNSTYFPPSGEHLHGKKGSEFCLTSLFPAPATALTTIGTHMVFIRALKYCWPTEELSSHCVFLQHDGFIAAVGLLLDRREYLKLKLLDADSVCKL
jgi:hypothetical protein